LSGHGRLVFYTAALVVAPLVVVVAVVVVVTGLGQEPRPI
jgi:hypothetical protein